MDPLFYAILLLFAAGGTGALLYTPREELSSKIGCFAGCAALFAVFLRAVVRFYGGTAEEFLREALFQLPLCIVGIAAALHAPGYLRGHAGQRTGFFWFCFLLTMGAMFAVTVFRSFPLFLVSWELMGLFSFFLVSFDCSKTQSLRAGWVYLLSCEAGGLLLMLFYRSSIQGDLPESVLFALLALGFGLKAGFPLLHVWLPDAHPAAPAPVSALMSAAMIPLGFCGLFRFLPPSPALSATAGWSLLVCGLFGAFGGILTGTFQRDLKRLLAYSSIENTGIIAIGFGLGLLGCTDGNDGMKYCGFAGAMLHIWNHALLKGTLFLCAGNVLKSSGTLQMDQLGGLQKVMPGSCRAFTFASLGICGLPPFCGFAGELLIYLAAFSGIVRSGKYIFFASLAAAVVLALTGAVACFALCKALFAVFLGEPRSGSARNAGQEQHSMVQPLRLLCIPALLTPFAAWLLPLPEPAASLLLCYAEFSLIFTVLGLALWQLRCCRNDRETRPGTWDCGYAQPTSRMEYTGSAFSQTLAALFHFLPGMRLFLQKPEGFFPKQASLEPESCDIAEVLLWRPLFHGLAAAAEKVHRFQSGYLHLYLLIMVLALSLMLLWAFFTGMEVR